MATLHCFGDSFTRGDGLVDPIFMSNEDNLPHWTEYIQHKLEFDKLINYAGQGFSNDEILLSMIEALGTLKSGDRVIVGQTFLEREILPLKTPDEVDWLSRIGGVNLGLDQSFPDFVQADYMKRTHYYMGDVYVSTQNYIINSKIKAARLWNEYYSYRFNKLGEYLQSIGVGYTLWSVSDQAPLYETIKAATRGASMDTHWSWRGSLNFGKRLLKDIIRN